VITPTFISLELIDILNIVLIHIIYVRHIRRKVLAISEAFLHIKIRILHDMADFFSATVG